MKIKRENNIPNHIAIVMDGNGRWALNKKLDRFKGHEKGVKVVKEVTKYSNLSESTIRRAVKRGTLKASNQTGRLLFKYTDVDNWLKG